jgi:hypothetical protein
VRFFGVLVGIEGIDLHDPALAVRLVAVVLNRSRRLDRGVEADVLVGTAVGGLPAVAAGGEHRHAVAALLAGDLDVDAVVRKELVQSSPTRSRPAVGQRVAGLGVDVAGYLLVDGLVDDADDEFVRRRGSYSAPDSSLD